ncbi:LysR family transcriptional regulator [Paenibacillus sedimenti]|uniref:LysR family transcriptional regulator n=1 Tax=Paenibacillus sedimenti TaxID=2770274 RepID=A0A926KX00_9BACL|nr:LysR family transcriptional regulator [Paenibacillus sedimenti]MBD0383699.1 LysR family transcriptional regulator [Paenibacillus sedimenti]
MIEHMDGRSMKTFVTVMEERSFSKAALKLGYVQSTVTMHISQLEQMLGKPLFRRLPRGVELTEAGKEVVPFAYRFLSLGESLQDKLNGLDEPKGIVRLRALESFCVPHMPKLLPAIFERYPQIQLNLETGFQRDITQEVTAYRVDLGIVPRNPQARNLEFVPLIEDKLIWIGSPELVRKLEKEGWGTAANTKVIGFGGRCIYQTMAGQQLAEKGISAFASLEFDSSEMIKQTVICGMGLALLPLTAVEKELREGKLAQLASEQPVPLEHGLIHMKGKDLSAPVRACKERIISFFLKHKRK